MIFDDFDFKADSYIFLYKICVLTRLMMA